MQVTIYRDDCPEGKVVEKYQADILVKANGWKIKEESIVSDLSMTIEKSESKKKIKKKKLKIKST